MKTPQQLYEDWERAHWAAQDIDLSRDAEHWQSMDESERNLLYWVLSSLMRSSATISDDSTNRTTRRRRCTAAGRSRSGRPSPSSWSPTASSGRR